MGLPGFSGFVAELQVLIGAWQAFPVAAVAGGAGVVLSVAFTLRVLQRTFLRIPPAAEPTPVAVEPVSAAEKAGAVLLISMTLAVGLYPRLLMDSIDAGLASPPFAPLRATMGWP
jgi:NADH-quinone oxidoreductase subunit M